VSYVFAVALDMKIIGNNTSLTRFSHTLLYSPNFNYLTDQRFHETIIAFNA